MVIKCYLKHEKRTAKQLKLSKSAKHNSVGYVLSPFSYLAKPSTVLEFIRGLLLFFRRFENTTPKNLWPFCLKLGFRLQRDTNSSSVFFHTTFLSAALSTTSSRLRISKQILNFFLFLSSPLQDAFQLN